MDDLSVEELLIKASEGNTEALAELGYRAEMAERKYLTGLLNDLGLEREIKKEENRVSRKQSKGGIVVFADAAGFKGVNDRHGERQGGDPALKLIANTIKLFGFRNTDIIANPGGDDFTIVMTDTKLVIPPYGFNPKTANQNFELASNSEYQPWLKIQKLNRSLRSLGFSGTNKFNKNFTDIVRMRLTVSEYGNPDNGERSLREALAFCEKQTGLIKKFTGQYVLGSR